MATRDELNQLKQQLKQAITDAATRITNDIDALKQQIAAGNPVTNEDLTDLQNDIAAIAAIDPSPTP